MIEIRFAPVSWTTFEIVTLCRTFASLGFLVALVVGVVAAVVCLHRHVGRERDRKAASFARVQLALTQ